MCVSLCVCVCVCVTILCACVFAMFCMKMFVNFHVLYACMLLICITMGICALYVFLVSLMVSVDVKHHTCLQQPFLCDVQVGLPSGGNL